MAANKTSFKKNNKANPKGRKKGSKNKTTKDWSKIRNLAANDYETAYLELRESMKLGEGWAHQIFFKQLVPKKVYMETIVVKNERSNKKDRIHAVLDKISEFTELTYDEAISEINAFSKLNDENLNNKRDIQKVQVSFGATQREKEDEANK